ncbi:DNA repair protein RecO [Bifidobacterium sp. SMB2]|uniref:DNA repair protein RecO n=1 Tax=Bifidobacterium saimiriisciurei TaxID=2661627 RepID=A0ABX0C9E8_9BIFI|nr:MULTISPECIES: DNA repair protein RecO [Bifidobacterium]NEG95911.1 DNA repair protein RecO [Bifidobacterium sp. SMB2]NEH11758.1 DNA repair protein RecO [Bifidobacterium saimiriisciurei]
MALYSDEGLVLRTVKLGEADRIITILTRDHGKIRAVAKGVRRLKSRFGARLEPFMRADLLIATGRSLDVVSQASAKGMYGDRIIGDYDSYVNASVVAETADRLFAALDEPSPSQYMLAVGAVSALARRLHAPTDIGDSYVLRALSIAGWTPRLDSCVVCGGTDDLAAFSIPGGGVMCARDRTPEAIRVTRDDVMRLKALLAGDWGTLDVRPAGGADGGDSVSRVHDIVEHWAEYYLERPIRSAHLLDS